MPDTLHMREGILAMISFTEIIDKFQVFRI